MSLYRVQALVLRTVKLGEADRIVSFCTKEQGKVRGVAKGVRKTKSRFGGRLEPITHVNLQCYEGRGDLDTVTQVETIDAFSGIRHDLDRTRRALSMLEAVDHLSQDDEVNPRLYQMTLGALRSLDERDSPVIVGSFFWKLLVHEGLRPVLDMCASCEAVTDLVAFDLERGGTLCRACRSGRAISPDALTLLRRTLGGNLNQVLAEDPTPAAYELEQLADESMEVHLERRLRSRHMLERA